MLEAEDVGGTLAAALRRRLPGKSWADVKRLCATGKVSLDREVTFDPATRLSAGQAVALRMTAPKPHAVEGIERKRQRGTAGRHLLIRSRHDAH